jgi:hypothetical protein
VWPNTCQFNVLSNEGNCILLQTTNFPNYNINSTSVEIKLRARGKGPMLRSAQNFLLYYYTTSALVKYVHKEILK